MKTHDDDEIQSLIQRALANDVDVRQKHAAFGELVRHFQDMAYACAFSVLGDFHLAQDAAQEAFITAFQDLAQLRDAKAFSGWLRRIVLTQCNRITRKKRLPMQPIAVGMDIEATEDSPAQIAERNEEREIVQAAIAQLPENQRLVITLFYINEYSQSKIAAFLEIPVKTVKSRLQFARKRLKERMITMVSDTLTQQRPSRDEKFVKRVLFNAIKEGNSAKVEELIQEDPQLIHLKDEQGRTPLEVLIGTQ